MIYIISIKRLIIMSLNAVTYSNADDIPYNRTGLLLGTSPITPQGEHNYYFDTRIEAASELYHKGKIDLIVASGGDYSKAQGGCNELMAMQDSLIAHGVPSSAIVLDYNGQRTINSIDNAKVIYGLDSLTIISQKYHNERAIWIAEHYGLHPIAYNASIPDIPHKKIMNISREFLARVKMFIDLAIDK